MAPINIWSEVNGRSYFIGIPKYPDICNVLKGRNQAKFKNDLYFEQNYFPPLPNFFKNCVKLSNLLIKRGGGGGIIQ